MPAVSSLDGLGAGRTATANGLSRGPRFHTNAGFTEVSGAPATVKMEIFGAGGAFLGSTTRSAPPNGSVLVTDIIGERGLGATSNFRIDYTVTGAGRVVPFATFIDDVTGDGMFQAAADPEATSEDLVVAQASHATGANGDFFRTDLHVTNLGAAPAQVTLSLIPRALTGSPRNPRVYLLGPGQTLEASDVLASEFGLGDPSAAGLRIHPSGPARLAVSTRTAVEKFGGTFGFAIPGLRASEAIGAGEGKATVIQLEFELFGSGLPLELRLRRGRRRPRRRRGDGPERGHRRKHRILLVRAHGRRVLPDRPGDSSSGHRRVERLSAVRGRSPAPAGSWPTVWRSTTLRETPSTFRRGESPSRLLAV